MTRDDTIKMAREAGSLHEGELFVPDAFVLRFARLIAAAEREACAKVCDEFDDDCGVGETWGPRFAVMIRARGEK